MKKYIYTFCFLFVLGGCGGGTSQIISQDITNSSSSNLEPSAQFEAVLSSKVKNSANDPEAMKRILGEDKDNDGIRDDMAVWIEKNAESSEERKVLRVFALSFQKVLQLRTREDAQREFGVVFAPAISCSYAVAFAKYPNDVTARGVVMDNHFKKIVLLDGLGKNTLERYWRYDEGEANLHGLISSTDLKDIQKSPDNYCKEK